MSQTDAKDMKKAPLDIASVDPNFKAAEVGGEPVEYVNAMAGGPFRMTGFPWQDDAGLPRRLPTERLTSPMSVRRASKRPTASPLWQKSLPSSASKSLNLKTA